MEQKDVYYQDIKLVTEIVQNKTIQDEHKKQLILRALKEANLSPITLADESKDSNEQSFEDITPVNVHYIKLIDTTEIRTILILN